MPNDSSSSPAEWDRPAYLLIRDGSSWRDVFRLMPGKVTTIGRAPTNRIVLSDEVCSRNHCEIFQNGPHWTLRDLNSRNGTLVSGEPVTADWELRDGEIVQIGDCEIGFTFDISKPFQPFVESTNRDYLDRITDTATDISIVSPNAEGGSSAEIIHRTRKSRFREAPADELLGRERISRELASLYRLALEMGSAPNSRALARLVLSGLFSSTPADIGAILLLHEPTTGTPAPDQLYQAVYRADTDSAYEQVSEYLSKIVLERREAVLAKDIMDDSKLANRESLEEIRVQSVICAPIRADETLHGLIHLYSTDPKNPLKPDDLEYTLAVADQMALVLQHFIERESLADGLARATDENKTLRRQLELDGELVGESKPVQQLRETIRRIAPTDATALIRGESGVGKELVARAIHFNSDRREGPFVTMNCAALSESLLESELFGHEKGSFTGATARKSGKFEQAHKGTLFLDEVGEMSQSIQAKFLRVLEGHPFERVGGNTPITVNVRVVAATNRDLEEAVNKGNFRKDLYFRLHVVELVVVPLRDRRSDIPLLARHFLERSAQKTNRPITSFSRGALESLLHYNWPGNVRELQNAIERSVILCQGKEVTAADIQLSTLRAEKDEQLDMTTPAGYRAVSLDALEREHILATLDWTDWNKSKAAQILGIERSTLDRKLKRYRMRRPRPSRPVE
jgi:two-component system, NtrC family, response regulator HydG